MRSLLVVAWMMVASVVGVGCAAPSIGSYGDRDLPSRDRDSSDDDDDDDSTSGDDDDSTSAAPDDKGSTTSPATATLQKLTVASTGDGSGDVTSDPAGVTCAGGACSGEFAAGTKVTLTAAPKPGSIFAGWTGGGCSGSATCSTTLTAASTVNAQFITLAGTWAGTYSHSQQNVGCTFNNAGTLENTMVGTTDVTTAAQMNGFELRNPGNGCALVGGLRAGNAAASTATVTGNKVVGTWTVKIEGASGQLPLPFEATIIGNKMSGKWTCAGCTGSFDISKQ